MVPYKHILGLVTKLISSHHLIALVSKNRFRHAELRTVVLYYVDFA